MRIGRAGRSSDGGAGSGPPVTGRRRWVERVGGGHVAGLDRVDLGTGGGEVGDLLAERGDDLGPPQAAGRGLFGQTARRCLDRLDIVSVLKTRE